LDVRMRGPRGAQLTAVTRRKARMRTLGLVGIVIGALWSAVTAGAGGNDVSLIDAVKDGNREAVRSLLKRHADVNVREEDGTTALHWAVRANDADTVTRLIRGGANTRAMNRYGITPLWL